MLLTAFGQNHCGCSSQTKYAINFVRVDSDILLATETLLMDDSTQGTKPVHLNVL
jgi:hypothetical protein